MSLGWHWFVIVGVVGSLAAMLWLLFANRRTSENQTTGHEWDGIQELDNPLPMWWVGLFVGSIIFCVPFLLYYPGLGSFAGVGDWSAAAEHDSELVDRQRRFEPLYAELAGLSEQEMHNDKRARQVGRRLFLNNCATCHGVNARGSFGFPDLTDESWIWGGEFETVKTTISSGRTAAMPGWGSALGEEGVVDVSHYVRALANLEHESSRAERGAEPYQTFCVVCHQSAGTGNPLLGAPDLTDESWLYGQSIDQITFSIRHGRQGNMPPQVNVLTPEQIHLLAGYVTSL